MMFGLAVVAGFLWQRMLGIVTVSAPTAAIIAGLSAGVAAWHVCGSTSRGLLREE